MDPIIYEPCDYAGGFLDMKPSPKSTLEIADDKFVLHRPKVFFGRGVNKLWARWTAVTGLAVEDDPAGARVQITTKRRGTGTVVIAGTSPDELWGILDGLADLKERFHRADGDATAADATAADATAADATAGDATAGDATAEDGAPGAGEMGEGSEGDEGQGAGGEPPSTLL